MKSHFNDPLGVQNKGNQNVHDTVCRVKDLVNKRFSKEVIKLASDIDVRKINKGG